MLVRSLLDAAIPLSRASSPPPFVLRMTAEIVMLQRCCILHKIMQDSAAPSSVHGEDSVTERLGVYVCVNGNFVI